MLRPVLLVVIAALSTSMLSARAWPCTCDLQVLNRGTLDGAEAVFSGTVLGMEKNEPPHSWTVTLQVERIWKGMLANEVRVTTAIEGGSCGYHFEVGRKYMVYAYRSHGTALLRTGLCTHTKPLEKAEPDRKLFGEGYTPADIEHFASQIDGSSGLYQVGHPIPLRMTYRGGIEGWQGRMRVQDGWVQPKGNAFLRIEQLKPPGHPMAAQVAKEEAAKALQTLEQVPGERPDFEIVADLSRSHHLELPGKYQVIWGCRLPSGFEVSHTSEIEILEVRPDGTSQVPVAKELRKDDLLPGRERKQSPRELSGKTLGE